MAATPSHPTITLRTSGFATLDQALVLADVLFKVVLKVVGVLFDILASGVFLFVNKLDGGAFVGLVVFLIITGYAMLLGIDIGAGHAAREYASEYQDKGSEMTEFMRITFYRAVMKSIDATIIANSQRLGLTSVVNMLVWVFRVLEFLIDGVVTGLVQMTARLVECVPNILALTFPGGKFMLCLMAGPFTAAVIMTFLTMYHGITIHDLVVSGRRWVAANKNR